MIFTYFFYEKYKIETSVFTFEEEQIIDKLGKLVQVRNIFQSLFMKKCIKEKKNVKITVGINLNFLSKVPVSTL